MTLEVLKALTVILEFCLNQGFLQSLSNGLVLSENAM